MSGGVPTAVPPVPATAPWSPPLAGGGGGAAEVVLRGRPCVLAPPEVEQVFASNCREVLPLLGLTPGPDGRPWKRYELPAFGLSAEGRAVHEAVELTAVGPEYGRSTVSLRVADELVRFDGDDGTPPSAPDAAEGGVRAGGAAASRLSVAAEGLIDRHIDFVNEVYDGVRDDHACWEGNAQGLAVRSLGTVLKCWAKSGDTREPRMALIVRLASELPPVLGDVCHRPRRVLSRVRRLQQAGRVQQVDAGCLRWLARQPGRTVAEKGGARQQVMGVTRVEGEDTPENRVVRDLLVRATQACNRYVREHRDASGHSRVLGVLRFRRVLRGLLAESPVGAVRPLVGVAQPNYVLQHDERYRVLWRAYVKLVRQQLLEDSVWRWRHRLWSEHCGLALLDALSGLSAASPAPRSDVLLHVEQDAGRFVDGRTRVGSWRPAGRPGHRIDLLAGAHAGEHPLVPAELRASCPDHVLVSRRPASEAVRIAANFAGFVYLAAFVTDPG